MQTVHDISVYTGWDADSLREAFAEENNCSIYSPILEALLRNRRRQLILRLSDAVDRAAKEASRDYIFISRSDSTLRGHYPLETRLLKECYERNTGVN